MRRTISRLSKFLELVWALLRSLALCSRGVFLPCCQAMKSFRLRPTAVGEDLEVEDINTWRGSIEALLAVAAAEDATADAWTENQTNKKWERIATLDLAVAIDWQLQATVGDGLWQFRPGGVEWPLARRQRLTLNWDSGPDNVCMSGDVPNHYWMRCSVLFDCSHMLWH